MVKKDNLVDTVFNVANALTLGIITLTCIYPVLHVLFASVSDPAALNAHEGLLLMPLGFSLESYKAVFSNKAIGSGYFNTLYYVAIGTAFNLVMTSLGAYGLSRKKTYWVRPMLLIILFTMFFSGGLIPRYLLVRNMGLVDKRWALILPSAISVWNLIVMRTFFLSIPDSLEEAARIDGANDISMLLRIILPLSRPVIAVIALYYGVGRWNEWFDAMVFLRTRSLYPLQLILREILISNQIENMIVGMDDEIDRYIVAESLKYSTIVVATIPILLLYPFLQKFFVKGVMIGAIKG